MTCFEATNEIPNYCYGEISSEAEESLESHLAGCEACRQELARHRKFLELLEERQPVVEGGLLVDCRNDLSRALRQEIAAEEQHGAGWRGWRRFTQRIHDFSHVNIPFRVPVGAIALVALGFVGARYTPEKFGGVRRWPLPCFQACARSSRVTPGSSRSPWMKRGGTWFPAPCRIPGFRNCW
jgi:hypothetical protein